MGFRRRAATPVFPDPEHLLLSHHPGIFQVFRLLRHSAQTLLTAAGLHTDPVLLKIILPVGISFYTFQSLGYVFDFTGGWRRPATT